MRTYLHFIHNDANADYSNITLEQCQHHCVQWSSPVCRSLVYGSKSTECYLMGSTKLDYADNKWIYDQWFYEYSYYQRDCI